MVVRYEERQEQQQGSWRMRNHFRGSSRRAQVIGFAVGSGERGAAKSPFRPCAYSRVTESGGARVRVRSPRTGYRTKCASGLEAYADSEEKAAVAS